MHLRTSTQVHQLPILLSFGDDSFANARLRITAEAVFSGFFGETHVFTPDDLPPNLRVFCEEHKTKDRGYGYYLWKPYLVHRICQEPRYDGAVIFWVDSGSWINRFGLALFEQYLQVLTPQKPFIVFERSDYRERQCVKRSVFHHLGAEEFVDTPPFMAGIFGCFINDISRSLVRDWFEVCSGNLHLIDQSASPDGAEYEGFEANRNDQGPFSLLLKKRRCYNVFPGQHILPEMNDSYLSMRDFPLIAMRDKS